MAEVTPETGFVLPEAIPTDIALAALTHILTHGHDGVDPIEHFKGVLGGMLGIDGQDPELAAAEQAIVTAMTAHPRDQAAIDNAMRNLDRLTASRVIARARAQKSSKKGRGRTSRG